jgi:hypothetical protein
MREGHSHVVSAPRYRNRDAAAVSYKHTSFDERRRHPRWPLKLPGRYMLSDGSEFPCETVDVSPGGIAIRGLKAGNPAERVIVYIEELGRIEGEILRNGSGWFVIAIKAPSNKQERLAERIAWLVKSKGEGVADRRIHQRIQAAHAPILMRTVDGQAFDAKLIDVSSTGAALLVDITLPVGAHVVLGDKPASVSRRFRGGLAVAFREGVPERVREILALAEALAEEALAQPEAARP